MKKLFFAIAALFITALFAPAAQEVPFASRPPKMSPGQKIDWDFTKMNFNMASGLVFDMMVDPQKYNNKTAKIKGQFASDVHQGKRVFAVFVWDATGCCPTGLNILPLANKKYPDDFPADGSLVTITGVLEMANLFGQEDLCLVAERWE